MTSIRKIKRRQRAKIIAVRHEMDTLSREYWKRVEDALAGMCKPKLRPMTDEEAQTILDGKREMLRDAEVTWPEL